MQKAMPRIEIVKRDDKEDKLSCFVRDNVDMASCGRITVLARSLESPVIRALSKVLTSTSASDLELHIILIHTAGLEAADGLFGSHATTYRWARQPRLADAHEQLVFGNANWIGDCMRRDPSKRDAYECYAPDCKQSARWATMAFERLWTHAEPMTGVSAQVISATASPDGAAIAAAIPSGDPAPLASTRH